VLEAQGNHAGAIEKYQQAIALDPEDADPYDGWGTVLEAQGNHAGAIEKYKQAIALAHPK